MTVRKPLEQPLGTPSKCLTLYWVTIIREPVTGLFFLVYPGWTARLLPLACYNPCIAWCRQGHLQAEMCFCPLLLFISGLWNAGARHAGWHLGKTAVGPALWIFVTCYQRCQGSNSHEQFMSGYCSWVSSVRPCFSWLVVWLRQPWHSISGFADW